MSYPMPSSTVQITSSLDDSMLRETIGTLGVLLGECGLDLLLSGLDGLCVHVSFGGGISITLADGSFHIRYTLGTLNTSPPH